MKISTALFIVGLMMFPVIGLAQTSEIQATSIQSATTVTSPQATTATSEKPTEPVIPELTVSASAPKPTIPAVTSTQTTVAATSPSTKCGVNSFAVSNECGLGVYKNAYAQCYDGFEVKMGEETSCKSTDVWNQYMKNACANHCSNGGESGTASAGGSTSASPVIYASRDDVGGGNRATPLIPSATPAPAREWVSVCSISDQLMQNYNELILELQKQEAKSDQIKIEDITRNIVNLKQYIAAQKKACADPQTAWQVAAPPRESENKPVPAIGNKPNKPVVVAIDRCNEVTQWETKIAYYKKLNDLNDTDLKKSGFSRGEIGKILQELSLGIEKVGAQCSNQSRIITTPGTTTTVSVSTTETVKPVVIESGQEIGVYYKARLEKAVSAKGEEKQIQELKTLRDEIDGLISNLIKSRNELEVSELTSLVKEVTVSRGEIKADDISVKTTEKKMLVNIGDRPVSIEPTVSQVLIRDKGLEVNTDEVMIKENVLSVGGVDVKMSASEVTEKLGLTPTAIELKEEDAKAVYNMKIEERRKLFGFIPFNSHKTVTADAENGTTLSEQLPWYNFLTTK